MIPKPEKDQIEVGNYHPISLINNDLKLMTKILADSLKNIIAEYIHKDQVGFLPGRKGPDQIRRVINLLTFYKSGWDGQKKGEIVNDSRFTKGICLCILGLFIHIIRRMGIWAFLY